MQLTIPAAPSPAAHVPSVQLIHGDCLDVMPALPSAGVRMVFADLPYAILSRHKNWDKEIDINKFWRVIKHMGSGNCWFALTAAQPFASLAVSSNIEQFAYDVIWHKRPTGALNAKRMPMRSHEHVLFFRQGKPPYIPQMVPRAKPRVVGIHNGRSSSFNEPNRAKIAKRVLHSKYPTSVQNFVQDNTGHHPTQKPVALLEWLIRTYTHEGDTVLDPVSGSATTAIAALRTGRNVICIEKDPTYFEVGRQRVAAEQARLGHPVTV